MMQKFRKESTNGMCLFNYFKKFRFVYLNLYRLAILTILLFFHIYR